VLRTQKKPLSELEDEESGLATVEFIVNAASTCLEKYVYISCLEKYVNISITSENQEIA